MWDGNHQIIADVIDNQFYEANCYIRGTNLVAKYNFWNGKKSEYTYYTQNAHGDVVNLTDKDGKVTKSYKYDAFGVEKNIDKNDTNAFRYCGEYYDKETATVYLRARNYNPSTGRFISRDSFAGRKSDPLSLNIYTYCHNNPIIYIDPTGNVISLAGLPTEQEYTLSYLQQLTDYPLNYDDNGNVTINKDISLAVRYKNGNELIDRLINSSETVTIDVSSTESNHYVADNWYNAARKRLRSGGIITFNPFIETSYSVINPTTGFVDSKETAPSYIALAHELIHADRAMRGRTLVRSKKYYKYPVSSSKYHFEGSIFGIFNYNLDAEVIHRKKSSVKVYKDEIATVGLKYNKKGDITENDIRMEHGFKLRGTYVE